MKWLAPWVFALSLVFGGCSCGAKPTAATCSSTVPCLTGFACLDGHCVALADSGPADAGRDAPGDVCVDTDGDGYSGIAGCSTGDDCNDSNATAHPGAREVCGDAVDNNCDGTVDEADCDCRVGDWIACYSGPAATSGVGLCHGGVGVCPGAGAPLVCRGEVVPVAEDTPEVCDHVDNDCDGLIDEGLRNACGECAPEPTELCGNDLDDDCDGLTDEDCNCDYRCVCAPGEPCVCTPPTNQPCYEGPFGTSGVGFCAGGRRDCVPDPTGGDAHWSTCTGQVLPASECAAGVGANGVDEDCSGVADDGCADADGDGSTLPADCDDTDATVHPGATEVCNDRDDNCNGAVDEGVRNACGACGAPALVETCANGLDDDCNGAVDDGCACTTSAMQSCYGGPAGTAGVGRCVAGSQTCEGTEFARWSACAGAISPLPEICNGEDDDCDGETDERWAVGSNRCGFCSSVEVCDGMDNDCDGLVDEGVANRCGECAPEPVEVCDGVDNDCDGVIDDGVTNACGTCPPLPCFTHVWATPWTDCTGTSCNGIEEAPGEPGAITLGQATFTGNSIYIAVQGVNEIAQLNTDTGVKNWQRPAYGVDPSRTTVPLDGSVWIGNRALITGNAADPNQSNVVHLDIDGNFVCRADVTGGVRGVAIDADGNVWAGTWNDGRMVKISGTLVDGTGLAARCRILGSWSVGVNIYGLAADGAGRVWTSSDPRTVRFDIATETFTSFPNPARYGIAPDSAGRIWFGDWSNTAYGIHALNPDGSTFLGSSAATGVTAITVNALDGSIWGSRYGSNQIIGMEPTGAVRCIAATPAGSGANPHGMAFDRLGRIWVPMRFGSGMVNVFDTACNHLATYTVDAGRELYSYSDMTGAILRTITTREGRWVQDFDSGYATANWNQVVWDATTPAGTGVRIEVRAADTRPDLSTAPVCGAVGTFETTPADLLASCPGLGSHRWLRVEAVLTTTVTGVRPVVRNINASWAY